MGDFSPTYNAAPSQVLPIVRSADPAIIRPAIWGLLPKWLKDKTNQGFINARAESVAEKPAFRSAFQKRRCLVPADGFFEWQSTGSGRQPHYITLRDKSLFSFAGIWEAWEDDNGQEVLTYAIITTEPNDLLRSIHNRMPVILNRQEEKIWLDTAALPDKLTGLLDPFPADNMTSRPVSQAANSPKNNSPDILK